MTLKVQTGKAAGCHNRGGRTQVPGTTLIYHNAWTLNILAMQNVLLK